MIHLFQIASFVTALGCTACIWLDRIPSKAFHSVSDFVLYKIFRVLLWTLIIIAWVAAYLINKYE